MKLCHISFELLLDYQEGRLNSERAERVRRHLATGCKGCERDIQWITAFLPALQVGIPLRHQQHAENLRPSEQALKFVRDIFSRSQTTDESASHRSPASITGGHSSLLLTIANLIFDSRQGAHGLLVPTRDGGRQAVHQVYQAGDIDVDVWQEIDGSQTLCLIGQALPKQGQEPLSPEWATLVSHSNNGQAFEQPLTTDQFNIRLAGGQPNINTEINTDIYSKEIYQEKLARIEDAEFIFEKVRVGTYMLRVHLHDQEIHLPEIKVGLQNSL